LRHRRETFLHLDLILLFSRQLTLLLLHFHRLDAWLGGSGGGAGRRLGTETHDVGCAFGVALGVALGVAIIQGKWSRWRSTNFEAGECSMKR